MKITSSLPLLMVLCSMSSVSSFERYHRKLKKNNSEKKVSSSGSYRRQRKKNNSGKKASSFESHHRQRKRSNSEKKVSSFDSSEQRRKKNNSGKKEEEPIATLLDFDDAATAMDNMDGNAKQTIVDSVRNVVQDEELKKLVTAEAVFQATFEDSKFTDELYPTRRQLRSVFDGRPEGCFGATYEITSKVLSIVFDHVGASLSLIAAQVTADIFIMADSGHSFIAFLFGMMDRTWFKGSPTEVLDNSMLIFSQIVRFLGVKTIHNSLIASIGDQVDFSFLLALIAVAVTNGASMHGNLAFLSQSISELVVKGLEWIDACFEPGDACAGAIDCDDGDLCTVDRAFCDEGTSFEWQCASTPVACPPGYSCNPSDGRCKPDDMLVPCVAVIDEDDDFSSPYQAAMWAQFRATYQARPFCLLIPKPEGSVSTPPEFHEDGLTVVHYDVVRDYGNTSQAMDWVSMCGLDLYSSTNVAWVGLFIDDSGSMNEYEVAASRDLFQQNLEAQGMQIRKVVDPNENWILPFLTDLIPDDDLSTGDECDIIEDYVFWSGKDSEMFDILPQQDTSSLQAVADSCTNDPKCNGFNTNGYLKSFIRPQNEWVAWSPESTTCSGLYLKEVDNSQKAFGETILQIARAELEVREDGGTDNGIFYGPNKNVDSNGRVAQYRSAVTYDGLAASRPPEPWCADFVSWVYREAGMAIGDPRWPGQGYAYCPYMIEGMNAQGQFHLINSGYQPVSGDIVLFDFNGGGAVSDHVGIIETVNDDTSFTCIEGNTGKSSEYEGVHRKTRWPNEIVGFGHVFGNNGAYNVGGTGVPCSAGLPTDRQSGTCKNYTDCTSGVAVPLSKGCEKEKSHVFCCIPMEGTSYLPPPSPPATATNQVTTQYDQLMARCVPYQDCTGATFQNTVSSTTNSLGDLCPDSTFGPDARACIDETTPVWNVQTDFTLSKPVYQTVFPSVADTPRGDAFYPYLNHAIVQVAINSNNKKERCLKVAAFVAQHKVETDGKMYFTEILNTAKDYDYGKWRGRGAMHLTGVPGYFNHYVTMAKSLQDPNIENHPESLAFPALGYLTGVIYIMKYPNLENSCLRRFMGYRDKATYDKLTRCIQGGMGHAVSRWQYFEEIVGLLGCDAM